MTRVSPQKSCQYSGISYGQESLFLSYLLRMDRRYNENRIRLSQITQIDRVRYAEGGGTIGTWIVSILP